MGDCASKSEIEKNIVREDFADHRPSAVAVDSKTADEHRRDDKAEDDRDRMGSNVSGYGETEGSSLHSELRTDPARKKPVIRIYLPPRSSWKGVSTPPLAATAWPRAAISCAQCSASPRDESDVL